MVLSLLALGPLVYNVDTFIGQYKFKRLCKSESGGRVYQVLEPNAGWLVGERIGDSFAFETPFSFGPIGFVRVQDKRGKWFDVVENPQQKGAFIFEPANRRRPVRYRYRTARLVFADDARFQRNQLQIIDIASGRFAATYTKFYYEWTKPERVILHAPTSQSCKEDMRDYLEFSRALFSTQTSRSIPITMRHMLPAHFEAQHSEIGE